MPNVLGFGGRGGSEGDSGDDEVPRFGGERISLALGVIRTAHNIVICRHPGRVASSKAMIWGGGDRVGLWSAGGGGYDDGGGRSGDLEVTGVCVHGGMDQADFVQEDQYKFSLFYSLVHTARCDSYIGPATASCVNNILYLGDANKPLQTQRGSTKIQTKVSSLPCSIPLSIPLLPSCN